MSNPFDRDRLTEVKPPLPPEPGEGSFALVETGEGEDYDREIHERQAGDWWRHGYEVPRIGRDWEDLHARGKVTVLVSDPADDAPELPWHLGGGPLKASVYKPRPVKHDDEDMVYVVVTNGDYEAGECRQIAAALLRAAREVEQP